MSSTDFEDVPVAFRIVVVCAFLLATFMSLRSCSVSREQAAKNNETRGFFFTTSVRGDVLDFDGVPVAGDGAGVPHRIRVIACQTAIDYVSDVSVGLRAKELDDPGLLRSAELLSGSYRNSVAAQRAEQLLSEGNSARSVIEELRDRLDEAEVRVAERYLAERDEAPAPDAANRFVVYAQNNTTSLRYITRQQLTDRVPELREYISNDIRVQGADGLLYWVGRDRCHN